MKDIMIDLETMGQGPNAAIIALGAVEFDIEKSSLGRDFYEVVDLQSSIASGGVADASTILWWMKQSDEARKEFARIGDTLPDVLYDFSMWLFEAAERSKLCIWGNGATFDNVILSSAYRNAELEQPWMYYGDRCYRTIKNLHPDIKMERQGTYHNALDDAKSQAVHLIAMLNPSGALL